MGNTPSIGPWQYTSVLLHTLVTLFEQDRASPSADHQMDAAPIHGTSMSTEQKDEGDGVVDDPGIMVEGLQGEGGRAGDTDGRENLRDSGARDTGLVHGAGKARIRGRGFQNMLCVGFAVAMCLNFGSMTALQQGFFAAEVACLPPGASETVLVSLFPGAPSRVYWMHGAKGLLRAHLVVRVAGTVNP